MTFHNIVYFIGGTGARIAEATAHLIAAGLLKTDNKKIGTFEFVIIDKDIDCASYVKAKNLIDLYNKVEKIVAKIAKKPDNKNLIFPTSIKRHEWSFNKVIKDLLGKENYDEPLSSTVVSDRETAEDDKKLLNCFFSEFEQDRTTEKGFYGHPSIGALLFNYMTKMDNFKKPEYDIAQPVKEFLKHKDNRVRVFIVGSVFGGTGASVFANLAMYIRRSIECEEPPRLFISGVLVLPYFKFPDPDDKNINQPLIDPSEFMQKSEIVLNHYSLVKDLLLKNDAVKNDAEKYYFDRMYALGFRPLHNTSELYAPGGESQQSHYDYIDILAASSLLDFIHGGSIIEKDGKVRFSYEPTAKESNIFLYKKGNKDSLRWNDFPSDTKEKLFRLLKFSSFLITVVYLSFKLGSKEEYIRMNNTMAKCLFGAKNGKHLAKPDEMTIMENSITEVFRYCKAYINMLYDLVFYGNDWAKKDKYPKSSIPVSLFDATYISKLKDFCELVDRSQFNIDQKRELIKLSLALDDYAEIIPTESTKTEKVNNTRIRNCLIEHYSGRKKSDIDNEDKVSEFINIIYEYCY